MKGINKVKHGKYQSSVTIWLSFHYGYSKVGKYRGDLPTSSRYLIKYPTSDSTRFNGVIFQVGGKFLIFFFYTQVWKKDTSFGRTIFFPSKEREKDGRNMNKSFSVYIMYSSSEYPTWLIKLPRGSR